MAASPRKRMVSHSELVKADAARVAADARTEAALDSLQSLVRFVKRVGGFMEHSDQLQLREAEALLVDAGRKV